MTEPRVLATPQASNAAKQLLAATTNLKEHITKVIQEGKVLADPNNWDGRRAQQWRNEWEADSKQLQQASQKIDEIDNKAQEAIEAIMRAGN